MPLTAGKFYRNPAILDSADKHAGQILAGTKPLIEQLWMNTHEAVRAALTKVYLQHAAYRQTADAAYIDLQALYKRLSEDNRELVKTNSALVASATHYHASFEEATAVAGHERSRREELEREVSALQAKLVVQSEAAATARQTLAARRNENDPPQYPPEILETVKAQLSSALEARVAHSMSCPCLHLTMSLSIS